MLLSSLINLAHSNIGRVDINLSRMIWHSQCIFPLWLTEKQWDLTGSIRGNVPRRPVLICATFDIQLRGGTLLSAFYLTLKVLFSSPHLSTFNTHSVFFPSETHIYPQQTYEAIYRSLCRSWMVGGWKEGEWVQGISTMTCRNPLTVFER